MEEIITAGFDKEVVRQVLDMVEAAEYKRRQSPPGLLATVRAFGSEHPAPITHKYLEQSSR